MCGQATLALAAELVAAAELDEETELVAAAVERRRERDAQRIIDALGEVAIAIEPGQTQHERVAVQASFLVERSRLAEFDEVLEGVAAGFAGLLRFKYTGPLPPHSFVQFAARV